MSGAREPAGGRKRDGAKGQGRRHDRRHGNRRGADRQRRRHGVRPARRAALPAVRRPAAEGRSHSHHRRATRAGLRLHGLRLCALDWAAGRLCRRAGAGRAQHGGGLVHGVRLLHAGLVHHRTGALGVSGARTRASARAARSAGHAAHADQMGGAHRASGGCARDRQRGVPADAVGTAGAGRHRDGVGHDGGKRIRRAARPGCHTEAGRALAAGGGGRRQASRRSQGGR